jgi:autotransporter passenger strand-loop-strand repeat protein
MIGSATGIFVSAGGVISTAAVNGYITVVHGGTVDGATINSGGKIELHGVASDTVISSGATLQLMSGAVLSGSTTFMAGATEAIGSGYSVNNFQVSSGLTLEIDGPGAATGTTTVMSGGTLLLLGSAGLGGLVLNSGATEIVGLNYATSAVTANSGVTVEVRSGGTISGATISGGLVEIMSGGIVGASQFDFATSAGGTLQLDDSQHFGGVISGFGVPGGIDLRDVAFTSSTMLAYSGNASSGVLTVSNGAQVTTINLLGQYAAGNFSLESDGNGGTLVTDPPLAGLAGNPLLKPHS